MAKNRYIDTPARKLSTEELQKGVRSMAKAANQRLLRLERSGLDKSSNAYQYVQKEIEKGTIKEYAKVNKEGNVRFSLEKKQGKTQSTEDYNKQLKAEYEKLQGFLKAKTSNVAPTKQFLERARSQMAKNAGSLLSTKEIAELWNEALIRKFYNMYGYTEFNRITRQAEYYNLSPAEISAALKYAGLDENSTDETLPSLESIEKSFKKWHNLSNKENDDYLILPEEL